MDFFDKVKTFFKEHWLHILILLLIFLVAFGFRTMILKYDLMFEFDSYWNARINGNLIEYGHLPALDSLGTYHNAYKPLMSANEPHTSLFWYIGNFAYKLIYFGSPYDQTKWINLIRFLPAIYGALIALAIYLLFRWGFNSKKIGYIAGFITAIMPAFIYRTMGGFYEPTSLGFLWMILGFAFLIKALQKQEIIKSTIIYSCISGLLFSIMAFSWQVYVLVPAFIEAFFIVYLIYLLIKKTDKKTILAVCLIFGIAFGIIAILGSISDIGTGTSWIGAQASYIKGFLGINSGLTVNSGTTLIGEESLGLYAFPMKYGMFLPFIILGLIALVYSIVKNKKYIPITMLTLVWSGLTLYFAWNKLKATFYFGLGLSILSAFAIAILIKYFEDEKENKIHNKTKNNLKIFFATITVFLLFGGIASGVIFTQNNVPNIISEQGWTDALSFMKDKLPENAKMFNWWSWGHWISFMGHKRVSTDNTNQDQQANGDFGAFFVTKDSNEALGIIKAYDADYVVLDYQSLLETSTYISYANVSAKKTKYSNTNNIIAPFSCQPNQSLTTINYNCTSLFLSNGQRLSVNYDASKYFSFPSNYTSKPTDIWQGKLPVIYYTTINKSLLMIVDLQTNNSFGFKLWFNSSETKPYFTEVYNNGFIRIWKVNKDAFTNVKPYMTGLTEKEVNEWNSKLWWLDQNTSDPIIPK